MRQGLIAVLFLFLAHTGWAACPATPTDCGSATMNNLTTGGLAALKSQLLVGSGTTQGAPYQFQSAITVDPSTLASGNRYSMFWTTLNYSVNTTNIWEGVTSFITVNGPGQANGEINGFHTYMQVNANALMASAEGYESSFENFGVVTKFVNLDTLFFNSSTGTANTLYGISGNLTNNNSTSGAVGGWANLDCEAMEGSGSHPTFEYCIRNANAQGSISSLGGLVLGSLNTSQGTNLLTIIGGDSLDTSFPVIIKNSSNVLTLAVTNSGRFDFADAGVTIQPPSLGSAITIFGSDNSGSTFPFILKNQAGNVVAAFADSGAALFANNAITLQPGSVGPMLQIRGPDTSGSTSMMSLLNSASNVGLVVFDNLEAVFANNAISLQPASVGPMIQVRGPDTSGSTSMISLLNSASGVGLVVFDNLETVLAGNAVHIEPASVGAMINVTGPDTSGSSFMMSLTNSASGVGLAVSDALVTTLAGNGVIIQPASLGAMVLISGPDNLGTTFIFNAKNASGTAMLAATDGGVSFGGTVQFSSQTSGGGTQTFTNSPCTTSLTTAEWIPVTVAGSGTTLYIPACH